MCRPGAVLPSRAVHSCLDLSQRAPKSVIEVFPQLCRVCVSSGRQCSDDDVTACGQVRYPLGHQMTQPALDLVAAHRVANGLGHDETDPHGVGVVVEVVHYQRLRAGTVGSWPPGGPADGGGELLASPQAMLCGEH